MGNESRFSSELSCQLCIVFCLFRRSSWLNCVHSGMVLKISSSCTRKVTKLSLSVKNGQRLKRYNRRGSARGGYRPPGFRGEWFKGFGYN